MPSWDDFPSAETPPKTKPSWDQFPAVKERPFLDISDTGSAIVDAVGGLTTTVPSAYRQLSEGMSNPWRRSSEYQASRGELKNYLASLEKADADAAASGDSSSVSAAIRSTGPSLGFSAGAMGSGLVGSSAGALAGRGIGALTGTPQGAAAGELIGRVGSGFAANYGAAYRMAGAQFLDDARDELDSLFQNKLGRPMTEAEQDEAYAELKPLAEAFGHAEAGPEAIGNMAMAGAGKYVFGLGKQTIKSLAKKALTKGAAAAAGIGTELAGETTTQVEQSRIGQQKDAFLQGGDPNTPLPARTWDDYKTAFEEVAPTTLATVGLMSSPMAAAKGVQMAFTPATKPTPEQESRAAEFQATPVEPTGITPEQSAANQAAGGDLVVEPDGGMMYAPPTEIGGNNSEVDEADLPRALEASKERAEALLRLEINPESPAYDRRVQDYAKELAFQKTVQDQINAAKTSAQPVPLVAADQGAAKDSAIITQNEVLNKEAMIGDLLGMRSGKVEAEQARMAEKIMEDVTGAKRGSLQFVRSGNSKVFLDSKTGQFVKLSAFPSPEAMAAVQGQINFLRDNGGLEFATLPKMDIAHEAGVAVFTQENSGVEGLSVRTKAGKEFTKKDSDLFKELQQQNPLSSDSNLNPVLRVETDSNLKNMGLVLGLDGMVRTKAFDFDGVDEEDMAADGQQAAAILKNAPPMAGVPLASFSDAVQKIILSANPNFSPAQNAISTASVIAKVLPPVAQQVVAEAEANVQANADVAPQVATALAESNAILEEVIAGASDTMPKGVRLLMQDQPLPELPAQIPAVHFSRDPLKLDTNEKGTNYHGGLDSVYGFGLYAAEPQDEAGWSSMNRLALGENRNDLTISPTNPLVVSPDTVEQLMAQAESEGVTFERPADFDAWLRKQVENGPFDALVIRGFDLTGKKSTDVTDAVQKRVDELWSPKFPKGKTDGKFLNGDELDAAVEQAHQEVTGTTPKKFETLNSLQNQIFVPPNKVGIVSPAATPETGTPSTPSGLAVGEGSSPVASDTALNEGSISPAITTTLPDTEDVSSMDIALADSAISALGESITQLPATAQSKWTPDVMERARQFFVSRDEAVLQGLTRPQRNRVFDALYKVDAQAAADQDAQDALANARLKQQEKENRELAELRAKQAKEEDDRRSVLPSIVENQPGEVQIGVVTPEEGQQALELVHNSGDVPGVLNAFIGTSQEFLADPQNQINYPNLYEYIRAGNLDEGHFHRGRAFVLTDGIGVNPRDREVARRLGITPGAAAVRRVLIHESLVHRGMFGLPSNQRNDILNWVRGNVTPDQLDTLAKYYPQYAEWRSDPVQFANLAEEFLAKTIDKLDKIPTNGPLAKLFDILRDIWRWITGRTDDPTIQNLKDVLRLLKGGAEVVTANETLANGDAVKMSRNGLSYSSPLSSQLAGAASSLRQMRDSLPKADLNDTEPSASPQIQQAIQDAYRQSLVGQGSIQAPIETVFRNAQQAIPSLTPRQFGEQLQALYDDNQAMLVPADSSQAMTEDGETWGVYDSMGMPARFMMLMPQDEIKASVAMPADALEKARIATQDIPSRVAEMNKAGRMVESQARELKRQKPDDHRERAINPQKNVAIDIIKRLRESGVPVQELPAVLMSPDMQQHLGTYGDPRMQQAMVAEALHSVEAEIVKAETENRPEEARMLSQTHAQFSDLWYRHFGEQAGGLLGARGHTIKDERYSGMFLAGGLVNQIYKQSDQVTNNNVSDPAAVTEGIKKAGETSATTAADEVAQAAQDLTEAEYERLGEEQMPAESLAILRRIRDRNAQIGAIQAMLAAQSGGIKASASEFKAANAAKSPKELQALMEKLIAENVKDIALLQKSLKPKKDTTGAKPKENKEAKRLVGKITLETTGDLSIQEALDELLPVGPSMREQMVESYVEGILSRAKAIATKPSEAKNLARLRNQLRRILMSNVKGEKEKLPDESLGQRALKAWGYVTSNDQDVREAWDIAHTKMLDLLREVESAELGIPEDQAALTEARKEVARANDLLEAGSDSQKATAQEAMDKAEAEVQRLKQKIADKTAILKANEPQRVAQRDALMDSTPRQLYVASESRGVLRDALKEVGIDTTQKLLADPQKAREAVVNHINQAVAQEENVDPARWQRDQSYMLNAFDKMVADLQQAKADATKKRNEATRKELFTGDQAKALKDIMRKLDAARPAGSPPLASQISWRKLFGSPQATQDQRRQEMEDYIASDPALQNLTQAEQKQLADLIEAAYETRRQEIFKQDIERLTRTERMNDKAKDAIQEKTAKLLEMINKGTFGNAALSKIVSEKYGYRQLNDAERKRLREIANRMQENIPAWEHQQLAQELKKLITDVKKITFAQIADAWWITSVLSGFRTAFTIGLGFMSGGFAVLRNAATTSILNANDPNAWKASAQSIYNWFESMPREFKKAVVYVMTGDESLRDSSMNNFSSFLDGGIMNLGSDSVAMKLYNSKNPFLKGMGWYMGFMQKLLTALDMFNSSTAKYAELPMAIYRNKELYSAKEMSSAMDFKASREYVKNNFFGGKDPTTLLGKRQLDAWANEHMYEQIRKLEGVEEDANYIAGEAAMTLDPTGVGGAIYHSILGLSNRLKEASDKYRNEAEMGMLNSNDSQSRLEAKGRLALAYAYQFAANNFLNLAGLRFARFGGNALNQTLSFMPFIGALRAFEKTTAPAAHRQMLVGNQAVGFMLAVAGYSMLKAIADEPDDEKRGWGFEGGWSNLSPERKQQRLAAGAKEYTFKIGDTRYNYANWPIRGLLSAIGSMSDMIKYSPEEWTEKNVANKLTSAVYAGVTTVADSAALSQFAEILGTPHSSRDPVEASMNKFARVFGGYAGAFVPNMLKDLDRLQNPEINTYKGLWENMAKNLPVYRRFEGKQLLDVLGEPVAPSRTPWSREIIEQPSDPVYRELGQLNSRGVWLTPANPQNRLVGKGRNKRELTEAEGDRYVKETGKAYKQIIERYGDRLLTMPRDKARSFLQEKADKARDRALIKATRAQ